jgi:hypothetical protein
LEFCTIKYYTNAHLVKPTVIICPKGVQCNLICISRSYTLFSMIFRLSRHFIEILLNRKEKKNEIRQWAGVLAQDHSAGARRGLAACCGSWVPRRGGLARPSRWPTVHAHGARAGATGRGHRGRSRRGGAGGHGLPTAPFLRGRGQAHEGGGRGASGKMSNDAAHRGGRVSVRWQGETGAAAFRWLVRAIRRRPCRSVRGRVR